MGFITETHLQHWAENVVIFCDRNHLYMQLQQIATSSHDKNFLVIAGCVMFVVVKLKSEI